MFRRVSEDGIFLVYCSIKQSKKMTSVKVKFRASRVPGKAGCVFYQVIHARVVRQIRTNFHLFTDEWDCCQGNVVAVSPDILPVRANYLNDVRAKIRRDCLRLNSVVEELVRQGRAFTVDDIVARYVARKSELSFFHFMYDVTVQLSRLGRERTSETYATTLRSFKAFRMGVDVPVDEITPELMLYYEAYLRNRGLAMNTISFYMRILRAVYNRAVERELTPAASSVQTDLYRHCTDNEACCRAQCGQTYQSIGTAATFIVGLGERPFPVFFLYARDVVC